MAFVYEMGLDATVRRYYNVTADSFDEAVKRLKEFAESGSLEPDDIELVSDDDYPGEFDSESIDTSEPINIICNECGEELDNDENHDCGEKCSECRESLDDGEGYDGLCGNCADANEPEENAGVDGGAL